MVKGAALGDTDGKYLVAITGENRQICTKVQYSEYVVLGYIQDLPAAATNPAVIK